MKKTKELFVELLDIIRTLRSPSGCPWDRKQTPEDVKAYLVEELYEVFEAIDRDEKKMLVEEIGDLLFMVLFLVNIYEEKNRFALSEAIEGIKRKMIYRHPHVFGSVNVSSVEEVKENWRILKEKEGKKPGKSLLDGIPGNLHALSRSFFLASKAAKVGFDWQTPEQVLEKVKEETEELETLLPAGPKTRITEEIGDMLFSIVNLSRHLAVEPEQALRKSNAKFMRRFQYIETTLKEQGKDIKKATLTEMDEIWEAAKKGTEEQRDKGTK